MFNIKANTNLNYSFGSSMKILKITKRTHFFAQTSE